MAKKEKLELMLNYKRNLTFKGLDEQSFLFPFFESALQPSFLHFKKKCFIILYFISF